MNDAAAQRGKSVRLEAPEGEYYAYTNADRIEQVLVALVDNAIKHGTDGCTVSVNLFENAEKNRYEFVVAIPRKLILPTLNICLNDSTKRIMRTRVTAPDSALR